MAFINFIWKSKCTSQKSFEKKLKNSNKGRLSYQISVFKYLFTWVKLSLIDVVRGKTEQSSEADPLYVNFIIWKMWNLDQRGKGLLNNDAGTNNN